MVKAICLTYVAFLFVYVWIYSVDCRIEYPYKPFKLMKQNTFFSKRLLPLCICKDKKRGMVNFTFFLEMLAHLLLVVSPIWLIVIYFNNWYLSENFYEMYRTIIIAVMLFVFTFPLTIAGAVHDHITKNEDKKRGRRK